MNFPTEILVHDNAEPSGVTSKGQVFGMFGHEIVESSRVTFTEQVYGILCEEIQHGRWRIGERLPGINDLSIQSGLSRAPIQKAFEMLAQAGYIEQQNRKGSFLQSLLPDGHTPVGTIGVAVPANPVTSPIDRAPGMSLLHHELRKILVNRNYMVDVQYFEQDSDWSSLISPNGPFGDRVRGIVSLHPFAIPLLKDRPANSIPLIFLGNIIPGSIPCVTGDSWYGGALLTSEIIGRGHRHIAVFSNPAPLVYSHQVFLEGHRSAMAKAGFCVDEDAIKESEGIDFMDLAGYRNFLDRFAHCTAIIAMTEPIAQTLISLANLLGIAIPGDLSVVSQGTPRQMIQGKMQAVTSVEYPHEQVLERALDFFDSYIRTGSTNISQVSIIPQFVEGGTLAAPRKHDSMFGTIRKTEAI